MNRQHFESSKVAEFYVVELLTRFMLAANLFSPEKDKENQNTLAEMFLKAQKLEPSEKIRLLKKLGDTSLYISGFFSDSLNRKIVDLDYYREMGTIAYRSLTGVVRDNSFQELYSELHKKFEGFVAVLAEISQELTIQNNQSLIDLYDTYLKTGSPAAKQKLEASGVEVPPLGSNLPGKKLAN